VIRPERSARDSLPFCSNLIRRSPSLARLFTVLAYEERAGMSVVWEMFSLTANNRTSQQNRRLQSLLWQEATEGTPNS
jgi:hypothetical protein